MRLSTAVVTQSIELFLNNITAVILTNMIQVLSILLKETYKVGIFSDGLAGQLEVILTQVETVHIVVTTSHIVIFTFVLFTQNQIVEHYEILAGRIELAGVWHIIFLLKEKSVDSTRV